MKCPIDHTDLVMSERQGIEIDYCPTCRGVWLDRGELDKIISRSDSEYTQATSQRPSSSPYASSRTYGHDAHDRNATPHGGVAAVAAKVLHTLQESSHHKQSNYRSYHDHDDYYKKKKKKSLVHQLFDF